MLWRLPWWTASARPVVPPASDDGAVTGCAAFGALARAASLHGVGKDPCEWG